MVKPIPEGYHSVTPYLVVDDPAGMLDFMKDAFGAQEMFRMPGPDGSVAHAETRIGDSIVMVGGSPDATARQASLYLYVEDTDATYKSALAAGAKSIEEPADQFYGDRRASIEDPAGNRWDIATNVEDVSPEEMDRRVAALQQSS